MNRTIRATPRTAVAVLLLIASPAAGETAPDAAGDPTPAEIFERRIMPIFKSDKPSSCVECHLAGVDLKDYILDSAEKTGASPATGRRAWISESLSGNSNSALIGRAGTVR